VADATKPRRKSLPIKDETVPGPNYAHFLISGWPSPGATALSPYDIINDLATESQLRLQI